MPNYSFVLRKPYKKGVSEELKKRRQLGKNISSLLNQDQTPVLLFISFDREHRFKCKTGMQVFPAHWDFVKQRKKQQAPGAQKFNKSLNRLLEKSQEYYSTIMEEAELKQPSYDEIKNKLQDFIFDFQNPRLKEENGFFDVYKEFIRRKTAELHPRTIQKFNTAKTVLNKFTDKYYRRFDFDKIDVNFIDSYRHYLLYEAENQKSEEDGYRDDTVSKFIENLKNFLRWSFERGYHSNTIFQHSEFRSKRDSNVDIVTLSIQELKQFYDHDFGKDNHLDRARDLFCFGAFTGQRWSDVAGFKKEQIMGDAWIFQAYKTKKETVIPLVGYAAPALDVLKKYKYKLPEISNQKLNDNLKVAAEKAKLKRVVKITRKQGVKSIVIEEPIHRIISTHMARRTAVSILLNIYKMPVPQVMEITGHSDFKTLKRYIDDDKDALRNNLAQTKSVNQIMEVVKSA
ncbi:tyrosine-type recombinase/integrase [Draconibacterium sediminis]|uniref:Tyr recombinase domain-containing protein n=1 Tax=Draconibacterium sediminis TaxID=1544798 RepID=A0A0D8JBF3_9BACT|nr:tyrosine-type recombinase/integrase [Draconibacterium sediminis]KJF44069.1 hypothetical protein LH29_00580 [Draconibacterium sediminis]